MLWYRVHRHRQHIHMPRSVGERAADAVAAAMGSWRFIIAQSIIVGGWIALNLIAVVKHFDPYPFILLNLLFSTQAAYAAPIIMMSQNRAAAIDRRRDNHEAELIELDHALLDQNTEMTKEIRDLARKLIDIEKYLRARDSEKPPPLAAASDA